MKTLLLKIKHLFVEPEPHPSQVGRLVEFLEMDAATLRAELNTPKESCLRSWRKYLTASNFSYTNKMLDAAYSTLTK